MFLKHWWKFIKDVYNSGEVPLACSWTFLIKT